MKPESVVPSIDLQAVWSAVPGNHVIILPNAATFTVIGATDFFLNTSLRTRESILGSPLFEIFPDDPANGQANGVSNLSKSLEHVIRHKEAHRMADQRYDIINPVTGRFEFKVWAASNTPVLSADGDIQYILHTTEDITEKVRLEEVSIKKEKKLIESEVKYSSLFNTIDQGLCIIEVLFNKSQQPIDYRFLETNPAFEKQTGLRDSKGKTARELLPHLEEHWFQIYGDIARTGKSKRFTEGSEAMGRWFEVNAFRVGSDESKKVAILFTDITERKKADQALQEHRELLQTVFDASPNSLTVYEPFTNGKGEVEDFRFVMANAFTVQTTGRADLAGRLYAEEFPHVRQTGVLEKFIEVATTGQAVEFEQWYDGEGMRHWFRFIVNKADKLLVVTTEDITEQKRSRQKLEESEKRFREMADASPVMIWTLDEKGNSTYYNSRAREFTGDTEEDLANGKTWQFAIHPDDIAYAGGVVANAVAERIPYEMECRMQRADGEWRWLLNQGIHRFGEKSEYFGFVGSSIDITDHKDSQQALQTALEQIRLSKEAAELGTFDMDLEKGTMHWDDRCRTLFGISHHDVVTYERDFAGGLHPDDRERVLGLIDRLFIKSISNGEYDVEYRTVGAEDGIVRWVRAKGKVYFDEQEKPVRFIGSVLDITEKVTAIQQIEALVEERTRELAAANEALQTINKELQRSNQNLEEFAHAASHDLKEPVRKIHFFTHQLKDQLSTHLTESETRSFNRIENATQRMGNLIDDLLLYSHVSQRPHEMESIDLNKKVQDVLEDLELDIKEKRAVIHVENLPVVNGYRRQLQQLFQNLISNALKYSKADVPPMITISAEEAEKTGKRYHLISVEDNGIGFDPVYTDKIFQMFTRLHGKAEYSGTGVGLSIVKKVVENHNGFIEVESEVNKGSIFKVYFPL